MRWNVENAESVDITGLGTVAASASQDVRPNQTTTYRLTARNRFGTITADATVTVTPATEPPPPTTPPPTLSACAANPATSAAPGNAVTISFTSANATSVAFSPAVMGVGLQGPVTVRPTATTTYTLTATGSDNRTATCSVTVTVTPAAPPPTAIIVGGDVIETLNRQLTLDASGSTDPSGGALTYTWTPLATGAAVLDQGQPQTRVQLGGLFGDYPFLVTVRNAAGQTGTATVIVRFKSTRVF